MECRMEWPPAGFGEHYRHRVPQKPGPDYSQWPLRPLSIRTELSVFGEPSANGLTRLRPPLTEVIGWRIDPDKSNLRRLGRCGAQLPA